MKTTRRRSTLRRRRNGARPPEPSAPPATEPVELTPGMARGIEATLTWLAAHDVTPYRFGLDNGIDPTAFAKLLRGKRKKVSLEVAERVERGTGGDVPLETWRAG